MEEIPPSYPVNDEKLKPAAEAAPPAYEFPTSFTIGAKGTNAHLVAPEQLKGHLSLLRLFYSLREIVEAGKDERLPEWARKMEPELRWAWFVTLAVDRRVACTMTQRN